MNPDQITVTEVSAELLSGIEPPEYRLYRADGGESRWYYCPETDRYYPSVTSVIQGTMPTPFALIEWMKKNGADADEKRDERAAYGTFLHRQIERLLIDGEYNLDALGAACLSGAIEAGDSSWSSEWYHDAKKDILAFAAFQREVDLRPIAVEVVLKSEALGYAGAVDLVCEITVTEDGYWGEVYASGPRKGEPKATKRDVRVFAIVDLKSGRKGFWENHEIQLHMYRAMVLENYPELPISHVFNWSPTDWVSAPGYKLKDQTGSKSAAKIPHLLALWSAGRAPEPPRHLVVRGRLAKDVPLESCYGFEDLRTRINPPANGLAA